MEDWTFELQGHKETVSCVAFSSDGQKNLSKVRRRAEIQQARALAGNDTIQSDNEYMVGQLLAFGYALEMFNFAPLSTPGKPATFRLSSNKSRCQGRLFGLRKDWSKLTKKRLGGERTMLDFFLVQYAHLWQHLDNLVHLFSVGKLKAQPSLAGSAARGYVAGSPMLEIYVELEDFLEQPFPEQSDSLFPPFTTVDKTAHNSRKFAFTLSPTNYGYWKTMIEPFLITNNLMGYVDGSIPCPSKTLFVTDGATVPKENPNYSIWVSNDANVRMLIISTISEASFRHVQGTTSHDLWLSLKKVYAHHSTSREYTLKTQLLRIKMHGDETPDAYLNRA
ncbi:hypothetical protein Tco_1177665 [Tanacetum coccineum]